MTAVNPGYRAGWSDCFTAAQATLDELRAEVERLTKERDEALGAAVSECDAGDEARAEVIALKAKQIDVDAVMRLADGYAAKSAGAAVEMLSLRLECPAFLARDAAREALRASLLGDGGTL